VERVQRKRGIRSGSGPPNSYTLHTLGNQCEPLVRPLLSGYQISPFTLPPQTGKRKASRGAGDGEISERISNMEVGGGGKHFLPLYMQSRANSCPES